MCTIRAGTLEELTQGSEIFQSPFWASMKAHNQWVPQVFAYADRMPFLVLTRSFPCFTLAYLPGIRESQMPHSGSQLSSALGLLANSLAVRPSLIRIDSHMPRRGDWTDRDLTGISSPRHMVQPADTVIISLTDDPSSGYRTRVKRSLKKAQEHAIAIQRFQSLKERMDFFSSWYDLYCATANRDAFAPRSREYLHRMACYSGSDVAVELWGAYSGGTLCAGALIGCMGDEARYLYGCSSPQGLKAGAMYLLQHRIITSLAQAGYASYDLFGIAPSNEDDHHLASLTQFKLGFGGERVMYVGTLDYPLHTIRYALYRMLEDLRFSARRRSTASRKRSPRS